MRRILVDRARRKRRLKCGLGRAEVARLLDLSEKTVTRRWLYAKAWLCDEVERMR